MSLVRYKGFKTLTKRVSCILAIKNMNGILLRFHLDFFLSATRWRLSSTFSSSCSYYSAERRTDIICQKSQSWSLITAWRRGVKYLTLTERPEFISWKTTQGNWIFILKWVGRLQGCTKVGFYFIFWLKEFRVTMCTRGKGCSVSLKDNKPLQRQNQHFFLFCIEKIFFIFLFKLKLLKPL